VISRAFHQLLQQSPAEEIVRLPDTGENRQDIGAQDEAAKERAQKHLQDLHFVLGDNIRSGLYIRIRIRVCVFAFPVLFCKNAHKHRRTKHTHTRTKPLLGFYYYLLILLLVFPPICIILLPLGGGTIPQVLIKHTNCQIKRREAQRK